LCTVGATGDVLLHADAGYDSKAGQACFLLELQAARKILASISNELDVDLKLAGEAVSAVAHQHKGEHFKDEEEIDVSSSAAYQNIIKSFKRLVKQQKSQVRGCANET